MESPLLTPCTLSDLKALQRLSRKTFTESFAAQNNPKDFQEYLLEAFSEQQLKGALLDPQTRFFFLQQAGRLAGYTKINTGDAQTELQDPGAIEIERFYISEPFQGRGLGGWMLSELVTLAQNEGRKYLWLGVWEENKQAIRFYLRHGFVTFGKHPYYVGSDRQTDWMMRFDLLLMESA
ncbi:MAG: GNAT family N-acetyltransferase [Robiginitalea sp.]|jgi:ribosomal protein S18 acetylase RimI-like enzyme